VDVSLLKTIPLFAEVPDDKLRKIAPFAETDEFAEGQVVVKEGAYSNHFFAIEDGTAKVEHNGEHIADLGKGDVFGEQGLLEKQERSATVTAGHQDRALGAVADAQVDARGRRGAPAQGGGENGLDSPFSPE
jgi:CRP/FNR family transcriptional regulator, cyclic AMP receptor protein